MRKSFSTIDRQLGVILLAARRTKNAAKFPLTEAERADERAQAPVSLGTQNAKAGLAAAEWAETRRRAGRMRTGLGANEYSVRLQKRTRKEFVRTRFESTRRTLPKGGQQASVKALLSAQIQGGLNHRRGPVFRDNREE
jgi:hypothetical protein